MLRSLAAAAALFLLSTSVASAQTPPVAGYHNGNFFVRSQDDVFRLYIQGRVHGDWLGQFGPGASLLPPGSTLADGFPAQSLPPGTNDGARNASGTVEEVQARVGVQF